MKNLFTICFLLLCGAIFACSPDTTTYLYGEVVVGQGTGSSISDLYGATVYVDLGDGVVYGPGNPIRTSDGMIHLFSSSSQALSFLSTEGWSLVSSTSIYYSLKVSHHHFIKRPKFGIKSTIVLPNG